MTHNDGIIDTLSMMVPILIAIIFIVVITMFIRIISKGISQWAENNKKPILVVAAKIVAKRTNVSTSVHSDTDTINHNTSTDYYITFEVEAGDRMEFWVSGHEYGLLVEKDSGKLKFQGTRYLGFERSV